LRKQPQPYLGSLDGDRYISLADYTVDFSDWFDGMQFTIAAGEVTDIASVPWWLRWMYDRASLGVFAPFLHDRFCLTQGKFTNVDGVEIQLSWEDVQLMFFVAMRLDSIPPRRAFLAYLAVLIFNRPKW
jgi:hypothetical protein